MSGARSGVKLTSSPRSWERVDFDWLTALWTMTPRPWPEPLLLMYLRYVSGCVARGRRYWTPTWCCSQVKASAHRGEAIGRRAIRDVSGCSERVARALMNDPGRWVDPRRVADQSGPDDAADVEHGPIPGSIPRESRVDHGRTPHTDVSDPGFDPGSDPDRASISARVHDLHPPYVDEKTIGSDPIYTDVTHVPCCDAVVKVDQPPPIEEPPPPPEPPGGEMPTQTTLIVAPSIDLPALCNGDQRLVTTLTIAGIVTVEALTALTAEELGSRPGIGPKRVGVIRAALERHGLALQPSRAKPKKTYPGRDDLSDRWGRAFRHLTGHDYEWHHGGRDSDGRALNVLYDAFGWSASPSEEVVARARVTVARYIRHCLSSMPQRVPTLYDLSGCVGRFMQADAIVDASRTRARVDPQQQREDARMEGVAYLLSSAKIPKETLDA